MENGGFVMRFGEPASDPVEELSLDICQQSGGSDPGGGGDIVRTGGQDGGQGRDLNILLFSQESPSSSLMRTSQEMASLAVLMPPAGLKPTL